MPVRTWGGGREWLPNSHRVFSLERSKCLGTWQKLHNTENVLTVTKLLTLKKLIYASINKKRQNIRNDGFQDIVSGVRQRRAVTPKRWGPIEESCNRPTPCLKVASRPYLAQAGGRSPRLRLGWKQNKAAGLRKREICTQTRWSPSQDPCYPVWLSAQHRA